MGRSQRSVARAHVEAPAESEGLTDTQRRLLTAALEVFSEKGFSGASTAEIAAAAGVAEKTLFANFKSKQELLVRTLSPSVFLLVEPRALSGIGELFAGGRTLREVLSTFVTERLSLARRHPKKVKLIAQELLLRPELRANAAKRLRKQLAPHFEKVIADLVDRGELRTDVPLHTMLRTVASVCSGYALSRYVLHTEPASAVDDDAEEISRIVELLATALSPPAKRPARPPARRKTASPAPVRGSRRSA